MIRKIQLYLVEEIGRTSIARCCFTHLLHLSTVLVRHEDIFSKSYVTPTWQPRFTRVPCLRDTRELARFDATVQTRLI